MVKSALSLMHAFCTHLHCYFPKSLQLLNYANQVTIIFSAKMFYLIAVINLFL